MYLKLDEIPSLVRRKLPLCLPVNTDSFAIFCRILVFSSHDELPNAGIKAQLSHISIRIFPFNECSYFITITFYHTSTEFKSSLTWRFCCCTRDCLTYSGEFRNLLGPLCCIYWHYKKKLKLTNFCRNHRAK